MPLLVIMLIVRRLALSKIHPNVLTFIGLLINIIAAVLFARGLFLAAGIVVIGAGLFDKARKGAYRLNSVGENLVAMVLPGEGGPPTGTRTKSTKGTKRKHKGSRRVSK